MARRQIWHMLHIWQAYMPGFATVGGSDVRCGLSDRVDPRCAPTPNLQEHSSQAVGANRDKRPSVIPAVRRGGVNIGIQERPQEMPPPFVVPERHTSRFQCACQFNRERPTPLAPMACHFTARTARETSRRADATNSRQTKIPRGDRCLREHEQRAWQPCASQGTNPKSVHGRPL